MRVQLAAGADAEAVGREVERILASHGMRSQRPSAGRAEADPATEPAADSTATPAPASDPGPPPPPGADRNGATADVVLMPGAVQRSVTQTAAMTWPVATEAVVAARRLDSVSVEEGRDGIAVRVAAGDAAVTRQVGTDPNGLDAAIVGALAELLGIEAELTAVQRGDAADAKIVTVLIEVAGAGRQVGSAVVGAGEAYAIAQAAWRALKAPE